MTSWKELTVKKEMFKSTKKEIIKTTYIVEKALK